MAYHKTTSFLWTLALFLVLVQNLHSEARAQPATDFIDKPVAVKSPGSDKVDEKETDCTKALWACPTPIVDFHEPENGNAFFDTGATVGMLELVYKGGAVGYCTATIIALDAVVTAYHCLRGAKDKAGNNLELDEKEKDHLVFYANFVFDGTQGDDKALKYSVSNKPFEFAGAEQADPALDYVVLKLEGELPKGGGPHIEFTPERLPPVLPFNTAPPSKGPLMLIHHPGGGAKQIDLQCEVLDRRVAAGAEYIPHNCGTWMGSSGALVLKMDRVPNPTIVALHYGWHRMSQERRHYDVAMPIERILQRDPEGRPPERASAFYYLKDYWQRIGNKSGHPPRLKDLDPTGARIALFGYGASDHCADRRAEYPAEVSAVSPSSNVQRELIPVRRRTDKSAPIKYRYTGFLVKGLTDCFELDGGAYEDVSSAQLVALWRDAAAKPPTKHEERRRTAFFLPESEEQVEEAVETSSTEPISGGMLRVLKRRRGWSPIRTEGLCTELVTEAFGPPHSGEIQQLEKLYVAQFISMPASGKSRCLANLEKSVTLEKGDEVVNLAAWRDVVQNMRAEELPATRSGAKECTGLPGAGCTINFDRVRSFWAAGKVISTEGRWRRDRRHVAQTIANVEDLANLSKRTVVECEYSANYPRNRSSVDKDQPGWSADDYCAKLISGEIPRPSRTGPPEISRATQYIDPARGIVYEKVQTKDGTTTSQLFDWQEPARPKPKARRVPREEETPQELR